MNGNGERANVGPCVETIDNHKRRKQRKVLSFVEIRFFFVFIKMSIIARIE